jgi:hypothetical protein
MVTEEHGEAVWFACPAREMAEGPTLDESDPYECVKITEEDEEEEEYGVFRLGSDIFAGFELTSDES